MYQMMPMLWEIHFLCTNFIILKMMSNFFWLSIKLNKNFIKLSHLMNLSW
uniref:ATP synthase F0 subunit 8 n=2 Tax=Xenos TaxID=32435 RepID=A0A7T1T1M2_9NEOP|nr:ATP synthase F0 subunit 8 [Xenos yangi]QPP04701.1 ATP synthase F0 subunit 8 [Xenos cf. moutoni RZ-2020]UXG18678.1 ATP synthase F0 subunit 8 [Xenos yangi]